MLETYDYISGLDEVGHGTLARPVSVGLAIVARYTDDDFPERLIDSKQLTARARTILIGPVHGWLIDHTAVHASPVEIDEHGIIEAPRVASLWTLQQVADRDHAPGIVIPNGVTGRFTTSQPDLFTTLESTHAPENGLESTEVPSTSPVCMGVKAGARCAIVAAASVLIEVERDHLMTDLNNLDCSWASSEGYTSPAHIRGLTSLGASDQHWRNWHLSSLDKRHR